MVTMYPELSLQERREALANLAVKQTTQTYSRHLEQSEVDAKRNEHCSGSVDLNRIKEEFKNIKKDYQAQIKNHEERLLHLLDVIKNQREETTGNIWWIPDYNTFRVLGYDQYGVLIDSRDMLPEERQAKLFIAAPDRNRNAALSDLPIETAEIIEDITGKLENEQASSRPPMDMSEAYLKSVPHTEEGWASLYPEQLQAKYGTDDLDAIRKMKKVFGKWVIQKDKPE